MTKNIGGGEQPFRKGGGISCPLGKGPPDRSRSMGMSLSTVMGP